MGQDSIENVIQKVSTCFLTYVYLTEVLHDIKEGEILKTRVCSITQDICIFSPFQIFSFPFFWQT